MHLRKIAARTRQLADKSKAELKRIHPANKSGNPSFGSAMTRGMLIEGILIAEFGRPANQVKQENSTGIGVDSPYYYSKG